MTIHGVVAAAADVVDDDWLSLEYLMCCKAFSAPPSFSHIAIIPLTKLLDAMKRYQESNGQK
jgi:hypothetical protein